MTTSIIISRLTKAIRANGVGGYYIFIENGVKLDCGRVVNEVRLNPRSGKVQFVEESTNEIIPMKYIKKTDLLEVYNSI